MANFLDEYRAWIDNNSGNLFHLLDAAAELAGALKAPASARGKTVAQLVNDDAVTVRAIMDGVGLAEIAGSRNLSPEGVLEALGMTVKIATIVGAFV